MNTTKKDIVRLKSGIEGFDEISEGGFVDNRGYLVRGGPGTGKTTFGMHFLVEGAKNNEKALFITLGESEESLISNAASIGLDTSKINFLDLSPGSDFFAGSKSYDLFLPSEVERDPLTQKIISCVETVKPRRIFLDSTSHLRYLSIDVFQFRKQLLSFIRYLLEAGTIVVFTSEATQFNPDDDVMYLADGVITLSLQSKFRAVEITKYRGSNFRSGLHTLKLTATGAKVYPQIVPTDFSRPFDPRLRSSGNQEIDAILKGGLEQGTVTIFTGPAGVGKTTLALQFARAGAMAGLRTAFYSFEESKDSLVYRSRSISSPIEALLKEGNLEIFAIEPLWHTSDEIASQMRYEVEQMQSKLIVIDSVSGYRLAVKEGMETEFRSILKYLTNVGVSVILINETDNITGEFKITQNGMSYLADNILFIRYLELHGELRKAIGVVKKRLGDFERKLREFSITEKGIVVGDPLVNLRGVLTGVPEWINDVNPNELNSMS